MSNNLSVKENPWCVLNEEEIKSSYGELSELLSRKIRKLTEIKSLNNNLNFLTQAEFFGAFIRDIFEVHNEFLKAIKAQSDWVALKIRTTEHSIAKYENSILINDKFDGEIQVYGYKLKPDLFDFEWIDNSTMTPWVPWGWKIPLYSDDMDEKIYFFNTTKLQYTIGQLDSSQMISFYGIDLSNLKQLNTFARQGF